LFKAKLEKNIFAEKNDFFNDFSLGDTYTRRREEENSC
jgi:hypothetical protein